MLDNEILYRQDINANEKIICGLAKSFNELGLYMTNRQIGEVLNLKTRMVSILLGRLIERGVLSSSGEGVSRRIRYNTAQEIAQLVVEDTAQDIAQGGAKDCAGERKELRGNIATGCAHNISKEKSNTNKGKFVPPSIEEIKQYITENPELSNVEPMVFFKYFTDGDWVDSKGNKVRNWKQKLRTWSSHGSGGYSRRSAPVNYAKPKPIRLCPTHGVRMTGEGICPVCLDESNTPAPSFKEVVKKMHEVG